MKNMKQTILEYAKVILVTVILTYGFLFFVQISHVEGQSMEPNYHEGNIVLVNKQFYHYDDVKYGDVIIPMVIIRRFECTLEKTKQAVVDMFEKMY